MDTHFTDPAYADDANILMCDQLQTDIVLKSMPLLLYWALSYRGQRQNVGAGDPPSTIPIDGVPVEGIEEFIYIGSKQSSNGYCRSDVLRRIGLAC